MIMFQFSDKFRHFSSGQTTRPDYGGQNPPGVAGGGRGEAGLRVPGQQVHDYQSDLPGEGERSYQWGPL